ncbi:MAG: quinone-dependent dihydroorotate dehydrogenase [Flavobacteriales bacterium]|jgi:dihydroorotate dehydrogenase|nr:quinone-dependent dihydroorotate dehydrogenase [Flavobacteriales bacterium]MBT7481615.1 quinone-dependent dihydroorotate dehydrogenase [Flavobacteriales bacterium]
MYKIIRFFFFLFDPEKIHHFTFFLLKVGYPFESWAWRKMFTLKDKKLKREVFGIKFPNPVGLAAGFDKDARLIDELSCFGFGFIEIGTLTPKPQDGNPKPRLFRLKEDSGIINRMGFNNSGVEDAIIRLRKRKSNTLIGGNIGKNKLTPNENATDDYVISFNSLFPYVDYFVVNVSSPNTPGLRDLQEKEPLTNLLSSLQEINNNKDKRKPILLKIAPDLTNKQLDDIIQIVQDTKIDGVVATNTTIDRSNLKTDKTKLEVIGNGGLSGKPVKERSTEVIRYLSEKSNKAFPIIGVGGIQSPEDAIKKLDAGASLVQIYTGFIYEGPGLVKRINKAILKR